VDNLYLYQNYGIYTMLNHSFLDDMVSINNSWVVNTEYSNSDTRALLLKGLLTWLQNIKILRAITIF
jgi:hypothetical protein